MAVTEYYLPVYEVKTVAFPNLPSQTQSLLLFSLGAEYQTALSASPFTTVRPVSSLPPPLFFPPEL